MNPQSQDLLRSAMLLSDSERAELAASLIRSLDPQFEKDADEAWAAEIKRRGAELDADPSLAITRSELWKRVDDDSETRFVFILASCLTCEKRSAGMPTSQKIS